MDIRSKIWPLWDEVFHENISNHATIIGLRGTELRNTDYILGVAVYTGQDTKMSQNSQITANKFSSVERTLNACFIVYLCLLLFMVTIATCLEVIFSNDLMTLESVRPEHWYLGKVQMSFLNLLNDGVSYLILLSYIIPASLYVTLEMQRVINSMFIIWDQDLCNAMVNSSDLNEELGQINMLFTDKTGTLTENIMLFKGKERHYHF